MQQDFLESTTTESHPALSFELNAAGTTPRTITHNCDETRERRDRSTGICHGYESQIDAEKQHTGNWATCAQRIRCRPQLTGITQMPRHRDELFTEVVLVNKRDARVSVQVDLSNATLSVWAPWCWEWKLSNRLSVHVVCRATGNLKTMVLGNGRQDTSTSQKHLRVVRFLVRADKGTCSDEIYLLCLFSHNVVFQISILSPVLLLNS